MGFVAEGDWVGLFIGYERDFFFAFAGFLEAFIEAVVFVGGQGILPGGVIEIIEDGGFLGSKGLGIFGG